MNYLYNYIIITFNYKHYHRVLCLTCYSERLADSNETPCELGYDL